MSSKLAPSPLSERARAEVRQAMLSVYYHSLGKQLELRGAPSVILPSQIRPLRLEEALDILKGTLSYREAAWRLIRGLPFNRFAKDSRGVFPQELTRLLGLETLHRVDELRREYRAGAQLLVAALAACAESDWHQAQALVKLIEASGADRKDAFGISYVMEVALGLRAPDMIGQLRGLDGRAERQLQLLEDEVGLDLLTFVTELADAVAFVDAAQEMEGLGAARGSRVYPVSSMIRQDSGSLTTMSTVTTLVTTEFDKLVTALDPRNWARGSGVIRSTGFLRDPFNVETLPEEEIPPIGAGIESPALLHEDVHLTWGGGRGQEARFENVLWIDRYRVDQEAKTISIEFSLCRSVNSTVMWDTRPGGILLDQGYVKVRPLPGGRWRVTRRKVLRFGDRTPPEFDGGWLDFGQALNHLAPAGLCWWLESETYNLDCDELDGAEEQRRASGTSVEDLGADDGRER